MFCDYFTNGESTRFERYDVLGILKKEHYPKWLTERLEFEKAAMQNPHLFEYEGFHFIPVGMFLPHDHKDYKVDKDLCMRTYGERKVALFTDEFHSELCEVMNYFRLKADTPILKSASDMIEICKNNAGFEVSNAYTTASYYKIQTEKNTYFLCCMPELRECPFFLYGYENKQLDRLKDIKYVERTYDNIEADKFFKSDDGFTEMFYNPDADAGGQIVVNEISNALIKEAAQFKT